MTRRKPHFWTAEEVAELIALNAAGKTIKEMARRLGVSEQHVKTKRTALGIRSPNYPVCRRLWTTEEVAELIAINAAGGTAREAAERLGMTTRAIYAKSSALGIFWGKGRARTAVVDMLERQRPQDRPTPPDRVCLRCRKPFKPGWRTNYICRPCTILNKHVIEEDDYQVAGLR